MRIIKKYKYFIFPAVLIILVMLSSVLIQANDNYPLENGEKLAKVRIIDNAHVEIFTYLNEQFYLKKLVKNGNGWSVADTKLVPKKWTGLNIDEITGKGDRELAGLIQKKLNSYGMEPVSLPPAIDYSQSENLPPVGEQYELSCVGWSAGYYLRTYQQAADLGWKVKESGIGINSHIFSPTFIYNQINNGVNKGATIKAAADLLKNIGDASLEMFPYIPGDYSTKPNQDVILSAYPNRIREWRVLYTNLDSSDYIRQKVKEYLNTGDLVVAGGKIGVGFYEPGKINGESIITTESYAPYMHAYVIVGYDDNFNTPDGMGAFKLINSWGREWGNQGFSYISYRAFTDNALEGYVFTDLLNRTNNILNLEIADSVIFNMDFDGSGRYDVKITNTNNEPLFEESNLRGVPGLNTYVWKGLDGAGRAVGDGNFKLCLTPYSNDVPKDAFVMPFTKAGKVLNASSNASMLDNVIQYVEIPVSFKADGMLNIKVEYDGVETGIVSMQAVKAGESKVYTIQKSEYDFNGKDLDKLNVVIDVR